ncbi:MAG TPA: hypothetical protein VGG40_00895 [Solirubrobacterales bacterium]|jgi:hypothetical protein
MIRLSAAHRDALYEQVLDRLSGIGDVWLAAEAEDFNTAGRLGQEYSDDLRLVLNDLGWGGGPGRTIDLTTPPDVLRRVVSRLETRATGQRESEEPEWERARDLEEQNRLVVEACQVVLAELDAESERGS